MRLLVLLLVCVACSSHDEPPPPPPQAVVVSGTLLGFGGPSPGRTVLIGGSVRFTSTTKKPVDAAVDGTGHFSATLPASRWTATALGVDGHPLSCAAPQEFDATAAPVRLSLGCAIP